MTLDSAFLPAQDLPSAFRNLDFEKPLPSDHPWWQDLSAARGDKASLTLRRRFEFRRASEPPIQAVFASHRGAGKTTELHRLCAQLESRYLPIYLEANVELDPFSLETEDLLFVIGQVVEQRLREEGRPLSADRLERVAAWFDEVVRTTQWGRTANLEISAGAEGSAGLPLLVRLFASLKTLLRAESEHREEIRSELRRYPGALLESINLLLDDANQSLVGDGRELLIVIDNLDRYSPQVVDQLLIRGGDRIRSVRANVVLTPPVSLLYRPESEALQTYFPCEVMHNLKLREPGQGYRDFEGQGRDLLLAALGRRIDLDRLMPDPSVRDRLVAASGGAIRELLRLAQETTLLADGSVVDAITTEEAMRRRLRELRDLVNANGWVDDLKRVRRTKQISKDGEVMDLLYHRLILKYEGEGWYDIHPLLDELPELQGSSAGRGEPAA